MVGSAWAAYTFKGTRELKAICTKAELVICGDFSCSCPFDPPVDRVGPGDEKVFGNSNRHRLTCPQPYRSRTVGDLYNRSNAS